MLIWLRVLVELNLNFEPNWWCQVATTLATVTADYITLYILLVLLWFNGIAIAIAIAINIIIIIISLTFGALSYSAPV